MSEKQKSVCKPMRKTITVEEMIKEQNYKPIHSDDFYKKIATLNIEEPIEELLAMLKD